MLSVSSLLLCKHHLAKKLTTRFPFAVFHNSGPSFRDHANWRCLGLRVPRTSSADHAAGEANPSITTRGWHINPYQYPIGNAFHDGTIRKQEGDHPGLGFDPGATTVLRSGYVARLE